MTEPARQSSRTASGFRAPRWVSALLAASLAAQVALTWNHPPRPRAAVLPAPPGVTQARLAALGEPRAAALWGSLWLQGFDDQAGVPLSFRSLDYGRLTAWLGLLLRLDPDSQYPLLLASRVYAQVSDPDRARMALDFVYQATLRDPNRRWRWLAEAAIAAKHRLKDVSLALRYARALTEQTDPSRVPGWVRQMQVFLLEDLGETRSAALLLRAILASGEVSDPRERHFLTERLEQLEAASNRGTPFGSSGMPVPR